MRYTTQSERLWDSELFLVLRPSLPINYISARLDLYSASLGTSRLGANFTAGFVFIVSFSWSELLSRSTRELLWRRTMRLAIERTFFSLGGSRPLTGGILRLKFGRRLCCSSSCFLRSVWLAYCWIFSSRLFIDPDGEKLSWAAVASSNWPKGLIIASDVFKLLCSCSWVGSTIFIW